MTITNIKQDLFYKMRELWNNEYDDIYPITEQLWERNIQNAYYQGSFMAIENNEIIGFIISKIYDESYPIHGYNDSGWISLLYVIPQFRNKGIGTLLLKRVESEFIKLKKHMIYIGKDLYNFFPGIPIDLKMSVTWFEKRGYQNVYNTCDLIRNKNKGVLPLRNKEMTFVLGEQISKEVIIEFLETNWPGRWTKEAIDYFNNGGTGREYLLGVKDDRICAFAKIGYPNTPNVLISYSLTWRNRFKALGGIGPLGVDQKYRHQGIGYDIVAKATNILIEEQCSEILIDWTNLLDFYRKLGYEVWKSYEYMEKKEDKNEI